MKRQTFLINLIPMLFIGISLQAKVNAISPEKVLNFWEKHL